jgi:hypothetical protein
MNKNLSYLQKKFKSTLDPNIKLEKIIGGAKFGSLTLVGNLMIPSIFFIVVLFGFISSEKNTFSIFGKFFYIQPEILITGIILFIVFFFTIISYWYYRNEKIYFGISQVGIAVLKNNNIKMYTWDKFTGNINTRNSFILGNKRTLIFETILPTRGNKNLKVLSIKDIRNYQDERYPFLQTTILCNY